MGPATFPLPYVIVRFPFNYVYVELFEGSKWCSIGKVSLLSIEESQRKGEPVSKTKEKNWGGVPAWIGIENKLWLGITVISPGLFWKNKF